jgi:hypothetical protein
MRTLNVKSDSQLQLTATQRESKPTNHKIEEDLIYAYLIKV